MQFVKKHFSGVMALVLLSFFAAAAFADGVECIDYKTENPDGRCRYARIWTTYRAQLYVVKPGDPLQKEYAIPDKDFFVYIPEERNVDTLQILLASDSSEIKNLTPVRSDVDSGLVNIRIKGQYPLKNFKLGTAMTEDDKNPTVSLVYNFYAPELEYSVDGKVVTDLTKLEYKVGDTVRVDVRAVIPFGPRKNRTDSTLNRTFDFDTFGESKNLKFYSLEGVSLERADGTVGLKIEKGEASFLVVAGRAVTDGSTFSMGGFRDPKDSSKFIVNEKFPGHLQFKNPDKPTLDGAAIFDTDGDGVGDSIAAWFGGSMDSVSVDSFYYSWPDKGSYKKYDGRELPNDGKNIYGLPDAEVKLQQDSATGALKAYVCSKLTGSCDFLETDLKDSIGAAIQTASLIKGDDETDTLVIRFNKDMDSSWTHGRGFLLNGTPVDVDAVQKKGNVWRFAVGTGIVEIGDMIKIETVCGKDECPDGILTAADGVPTARNNREVPVTSAGRIYLSNENNGFYDRDGDGRMDSVSVGFSMPVTKGDLKNADLRFYWLDEKGELLEIVPDVKDLVISDDGLVVSYPLDPEKLNVKNMLTAIDKSYSKDGAIEYGYAKLFNKVTVDGKDSVYEDRGPMKDYMPPVISNTFLKPESFQEMEPDLFKISFSEPIDHKDLNLTDDCLSFYVDGSWVHYDLSDAVWSESGFSLTIRMEAGDGLSDRMNPADSVRFGNFTSGLKDRYGNYVAEVSPAVMVKGDPRVILQATAMADLSRAEELNTRDTAFTLSHFDGDLNEEQKASLGVLMDVGFSTIMRDSAGVSKVDPEKIGLRWELFVYTNLGAYVGSASDKMDCKDRYFKGNCLENPDKLYVRWNMRADNGRKVGVGLYLAKFVIHVYGAENDFKVERVFRWGVTAKRH